MNVKYNNSRRKKVVKAGKKWASNIESNMPSMDMMDGVGSELESKGKAALGKRYKSRM